MSTASVARHTATELTFRTLDESGELAYFLSESASRPGKRNVTVYDLTNGDVFCFCQAAELGRECWHAQLVREAWMGHIAAEQLAKATTLAEVAAIGRAAKARIAAWGALTVLVSPLDRAVYTEARRTYARIHRAGEAVTLTIEQATAIVAEWEGMSYSDRHIDMGYGGMTAYVMAGDVLIAQVSPLANSCRSARRSATPAPTIR